ncbi:MAG: hypothetical protein ACK47B_12330 [Armatimonadota bacterium]
MSYEFLGTAFTADAIAVRLLDHRCHPGDAEARAMDRLPLIDLLRDRVQPTAVPALLELVTRGSDGSAGLAGSLLRRYDGEAAVRSVLEQRWVTASPYLRNRLMWRLLDAEDLDPAWQARFLGFIRSEWNTFRDFNREFYGTSERGLGRVLSRIADPTFPSQKKWVYLWSIPCLAEDPEVTCALIRGAARTVADGSLRDAEEAILTELGGQRRLPLCGSEPEAPGPKSASWGFVAEAVLASLRRGNRPSEEEADYLNRLPFIDVARDHVTDSDLQWLLEVINQESGPFAALCLSLLQKYSCRREVQDALRARWENAGPCLKAHLLWRLLDDPSLQWQWHKTLVDFVLSGEGWPVFRDVSRTFLGTPETVVTEALKRITSPAFPESKKWAYLCRVPEVAADRAAARAFVSLGCNSSDPLTRYVAEQLLERFYP